MYICMSLYTCAFAEVYCAFSVARSSKGQRLCQADGPAAGWVPRGRGMGRDHPARAAVPRCQGKDSRAGLLTATRVSQESSEHASLQGRGRSKVKLGSQVRVSGSPKYTGRRRRPCGVAQARRTKVGEDAPPSSFSCDSLVGPDPHAQGGGTGKTLQKLVVHSGS